jgi:hypothetical protein
MAKLNAAERKRIPEEKFALPGRRFPVEDKAHAGNAKARATQMVAKGMLTGGQKEIIDRKANAVLGKAKKK